MAAAGQRRPPPRFGSGAVRRVIAAHVLDIVVSEESLSLSSAREPNDSGPGFSDANHGLRPHGLDDRFGGRYLVSPEFAQGVLAVLYEPYPVVCRARPEISDGTSEDDDDSLAKLDCSTLGVGRRIRVDEPPRV